MAKIAKGMLIPDEIAINKIYLKRAEDNDGQRCRLSFYKLFYL
jgi:hypothetical protein